MWDRRCPKCPGATNSGARPKLYLCKVLRGTTLSGTAVEDQMQSDSLVGYPRSHPKDQTSGKSMASQRVHYTLEPCGVVLPGCIEAEPVDDIAIAAFEPGRNALGFGHHRECIEDLIVDQ